MVHPFVNLRLKTAVESKNLLRTVRLLGYGADPNSYYLLHYACKHGYAYIAQALLEFGADSNLKNENNMSPLHIICTDWKYTSIEQKIDLLDLLKEYNVDINLTGSYNGIIMSSIDMIRQSHRDVPRELIMKLITPY